MNNLVKHINYDKNFKLNHTQLSTIVKIAIISNNKFKTEYGLDVTFGNHCKNLNVLYLSLIYQPKDIFFYIRSSKKCQDYARVECKFNRGMKKLKK